MFFKEIGAIFFPPSSPPKRAERNGRNNCRQAGTIVDAGQMPISISATITILPLIT
jgi:hypothetical protein